MNEFKERIIKFARESRNLGQTRFEEYCNIPLGTINKIKEGGISTRTLTKIAEKCPDLNLRWLLFGYGEMLEKKEAPVMDTDAKQAIYDLTLENVRLKKRIAELEGKGAVAV